MRALGLVYELMLFTCTLSKLHHRLDPMYSVLLTWWCEETDHEADPLCNLLFADRHLTQTADGTQLRGLDATMVASKPSAEEHNAKFNPLLSAFCAGPKSMKVRQCSPLTAGTLSTLPGVFKGEPPIPWQATATPVHKVVVQRGLGNGIAKNEFQKIALHAASPPTSKVEARSKLGIASPVALKSALAEQRNVDVAHNERRVNEAVEQRRASRAALRLGLPSAQRNVGRVGTGPVHTMQTGDGREAPFSSDDFFSVASWSCRDGQASMATMVVSYPVCKAYQQLLTVMPKLVDAYPHFTTEASKEQLRQKIASERRLARMKGEEQADSQVAQTEGLAIFGAGQGGLLYIVMGMLLAASPFVLCYWSPTARSYGSRCVASCNSICLRVYHGMLQGCTLTPCAGKLYRLLSRKNTARREAERVVRSLTTTKDDPVQVQQMLDEKDSA